MGRLSSAAKKTSQHRSMYIAMRNDLVERLETTSSGRDYASLMRSLIQVQDRLSAIDGLDVSGKSQKPKKSHHTNPLDQARKNRSRMRLVNG